MGDTNCTGDQQSASAEKHESSEMVGSVFIHHDPKDETTERIRYGDCVIIYFSLLDMVPLYLKEGGSYQCKYGTFPHERFVGKEWGSRIVSSCKNKGHVVVLKPTPELWCNVVPHRTQIVYTPDWSQIIFELELKPGSVVVESGTGSAALTHALVRSVQPTGRVITHEFHQGRAEKAQQEFRNHKLPESLVRCVHRDVIVDGFDVNVESEGKVDAVFLDLPMPEKAVKQAHPILKEGGRICTFTPCIEQAMVVCETLRALDYQDINTIESLRREYDVRHETVEECPWDQPDVYLTKRTQHSMRSGRPLQTIPKKGQKPLIPTSMQGRLDMSKDSGKSNDGEVDEDTEEPPAKKPKTEANKQTDFGGVKFQQHLICKLIESMPGHTAYLTFATRKHNAPDVSVLDGLRNGQEKKAAETGETEPAVDCTADAQPESD
eukprot:Clim_evm6s2 gene=Clim_evmTU6s2